MIYCTIKNWYKHARSTHIKVPLKYMKKLIAGNWKMNLTMSDAENLADTLTKNMAGLSENVEILLCPAYPHLTKVKSLFRTIGGQDCSAHENGAHTGDVSARMLSDIGCQYVILGHSERRAGYKEDESLLAKKMAQALSAGLHIIYCVGETLEQRQNNQARDIVKRQLAPVLKLNGKEKYITIAYEPVWAIGTGESASPENIEDMHNWIRENLKESLEYGEQIRILYGGSVKSSNASEIFRIKHVNGALIGGASLKAQEFLDIARMAVNNGH